MTGITLTEAARVSGSAAPDELVSEVSTCPRSRPPWATCPGAHAQSQPSLFNDFWSAVC